MTVPRTSARFSLHTRAASKPSGRSSRRDLHHLGGAGPRTPLPGHLRAPRREHADHPPRRRPRDVPGVLRHRAPGDADQEAGAFPGGDAADPGPDEVVGRGLRPTTWGQGSPDDRGSGHLPGADGLRPDLRRSGAEQGSLPGIEERPLSRTRPRSKSLEYYLEHFVWGGLQRTDDETPYPYGVYGRPTGTSTRRPRRIAAPNAHGERRSGQGARVAILRLPPRDHAVLPHVPDRQDVPGDVDVPRCGRVSGPGLGDRHGPSTSTPTRSTRTTTRPTSGGSTTSSSSSKLIDALEREGLPGAGRPGCAASGRRRSSTSSTTTRIPFRSEYAFDRTAFESTLRAGQVRGDA